MTSECTTADVLRGVDLTGRTAVITGASSGLGLETARALQSVGCEVAAAVRDLDKTRAALDGATLSAGHAGRIADGQGDILRQTVITSTAAAGGSALSPAAR